MTVSLAGFGATIVISAVSQNILKDKGKPDLAETLNSMTVLGAATYAAFFVWKLLEYSVSIFL